MALTLYVHIGIHKTGTSAIQNVCMANQRLLADAGILFPSAGFQAHPERGPNPTAGHHRLVRFMKRPDRVPLRREVRALLEEIEAANCASVVLSSAVLSNPKNHKALAGVEWFAKRGFEIKIVAYLRRQDRWLSSFHLQRLKGDGLVPGETRSIEEVWREEGAAWLDYRRRLGPWVEAVGVENAVIRSYDDVQQQGGVVGDFVTVIGADPSQLDLSSAAELHNPSVPAAAAEFLRGFNAVADSSFNRRADLLNAIRETSLFGAAPGAVLSPELWNELKSAYAQQNEELRRDWLSGPSKLFSFEDARPPKPAPPAMTWRDTKLLLEVILPRRQPALSVRSNSFGIVTTCSEDRPQLREFANYHLNLGASCIVLFFDRPDDAAREEFRDEPRVVAIPCDEVHWQMLLGRDHPASFHEAQVSNVRHGASMLRERGISWICTIDVDELLYSERPLEEVLSTVVPEIEIVLTRPMEAVQHREMRADGVFRSRYFREFVRDPSAEQSAALLRHVPAVVEFGRCGCFNHTAGKSLFRSTAEVESYGNHLPRLRNRQWRAELSRDIELLHFDAISYETWRRRWRARIEGEVLKVWSAHRVKQHEYLRRRFEAEGEAAMERVFGEWHVYSPETVSALTSAGLLRRIEIPSSLFEAPPPVQRAAESALAP